jgi:hypothetical protein
MSGSSRWFERALHDHEEVPIETVKRLAEVAARNPEDRTRPSPSSQTFETRRRRARCSCRALS